MAIAPAAMMIGPVWTVNWLKIVKMVLPVWVLPEMENVQNVSVPGPVKNAISPPVAKMALPIPVLPVMANV